MQGQPAQNPASNADLIGLFCRRPRGPQIRARSSGTRPDGTTFTEVLAVRVGR